jgi:[glutamine synthetase] adenylyltransferase / [glutamine synthetase]-adenylyl-L-tyrosine phosphorylase
VKTGQIQNGGSSFAFEGRSWPKPYDTAAADRFVERITAALNQNDEANTSAGRFLASADGLLRCIGGNSPFLSALALREYATILQLWCDGPDTVFDATLARLDQTNLVAKRADVSAALRQAKREAALAIAIADIAQLWPLETITGALSRLASSALRLSIRHLMRTAHENHEIQLPDPEEPDRDCGFVILGMGKLGAGELNYSSDIDLILIYDAEAACFRDGKATQSLGSFTSRMARDLVTLMDARDFNGYVFRTDLRLRPDPAAMPPAVSLQTALIYYESMGQQWERTAMIKARPVAGDIALGNHFIDAIRPFVWRRGLDFAAVGEIHAMKRRINAARKVGIDAEGNLAGFNVKLGEGGIREIEFIAQTLQVVWGGHDPSLRLKATLPTLTRLTERSHLTPTSTARLTQSYRFLRQVEHRLQMVNDRQTHSLPDKPVDLEHVATFLGYPDAATFTTNLRWHLHQVREDYRLVFETTAELASTDGNKLELDFGSEEQDPATVATLNAMGFQDAARITASVRTWFAGRVRALRSERARELMTTVLPAVLTELGKQANPDEAFGRFERLINGLPAGIQIMSLFQHNPALLERVASVLGAAARLSDHLIRYPSALEGLLSGEEALTPKDTMRARLADASRLEDAIQIVRRIVKQRDFDLSVADLEGRIGIDQSGLRRTMLAEAAIAAAVPRVLSDFAARSGRVPGGRLAVVTMGKAGGREMMAGSDLDLMFIYHHPPDVTSSIGARELPTSQWFVRAVQACIAALTVPGAEGPMYLLDMRLRPSGSKGPLAVSLESFKHYHDHDAWTWERMALTRARVIAGNAVMRRDVNAAIDAALHHATDPDRIRADARDMRRRMLKDLPAQGDWDVKLRPGGLIEVEFVAQTLQLLSATQPWFRRNPTTRAALSHLAAHGAIRRADANTLIRAGRIWRTIQSILRLTVGHIKSDTLPDMVIAHVLRALAAAGLTADDAANLLSNPEILAGEVRAIFERTVGAL